jgi:hypothetical protein
MGECNAMAEWASIRTAVVSIAWVILTAGATTFVAANPATLIKLIVPNAPGGGIDFAARLLAQEVGQTQQITIIVENRPGAGGVIGAEDVAHAAPDGNTLLLDAGNLIVNSQVRTVHYDPLVSFAPICNLIAAPNLIVVSGTSPFRTLADFINEARAKPGAVTLASNGPGTALQIEFEKLKRAANVDIGFISYRGTTPAVEAVLFYCLPHILPCPRLNGLADYRCCDLIGDLDVPHFAFALRGEVGEQLRDYRHIAYLVAAQAEATSDVFERGPAEHRQAIVEAVGAQLVKLRAISAVVHRADQDAKSLTLERLEFLDMEQEPAVAFEQHDLAVAALPARSAATPSAYDRPLPTAPNSRTVV